MMTRPDLSQIVGVVAEITLCNPKELVGTARTQMLVMPRKLIWYLAVHYGHSYGDIADFFSDRSECAIKKGVVEFRRRHRTQGSFTATLVDKVKRILDDQLQRESEAGQKLITDVVMSDLETVKKLRKQGFTVDKIAQRTGLDEMYVAKVCGLPMWRGKETQGASR